MRHLASALAALLLAAGSARAEIRNPVRVGVLNDTSGPYSDNAGTASIAVARMAAEDFMRAHPDIKVEILAADHQNKADVASTIARRWIDTEGVDAVADLPNSAVGLAVNAVLRDSHAVVIASSAATSDLTGAQCSPNTFQWTFDTYAVSRTVATYLTQHGVKRWFFIGTDNALGRSLVRDATPLVEASGGKVVGSVFTPLNTADYSSTLIQAQAQDPDVVSFATAGGDTIALLKQSVEFGLHRDGRVFAPLLATINDVHAAGHEATRDTVTVEPFYWDQDEASRAFAKRFVERVPGRVPTGFHAGVYASITAYLDAVAQANDKNAAAVMRVLHGRRFEDPLFGPVVVREDGRTIHAMYVFRVKSGTSSRTPWDLLERIGMLSGPEAFRPVDQGGCPLVGKGRERP